METGIGKRYAKMAAVIFAVIATAGVVGWALLRYAAPDYYFAWYPAVPAFFAIMGLGFVVAMYRSEGAAQNRKVVVFMAMRGIKLGLIVAGLLLYYLLARERMAEFGIVVFIFFNIHAVTELILLNKLNKSAEKAK